MTYKFELNTEQKAFVIFKVTGLTDPVTSIINKDNLKSTLKDLVNNPNVQLQSKVSIPVLTDELDITIVEYPIEEVLHDNFEFPK